MTPDELKQLIAAGDRDALCTALAPLDDAQRKALSAAAKSFYEQVDKVWSAIHFKEKKAKADVPTDPDFMKLVTSTKYDDWRVPRYAADVAVLALCERQDLEKPYDRGLSWFISESSSNDRRMHRVSEIPPIDEATTLVRFRSTR